MYPIVKVQGVKYRKGHKNFPQFPYQAGGPLVPDPRFPSDAQEYISWKRKPHKHEPDELGRVPSGIDRVKEGNAIRLVRAPLTYKWEFDSTPIAVELMPEISRALERGDIELATGKVKGDK